MSNLKERDDVALVQHILVNLVEHVEAEVGTKRHDETPPNAYPLEISSHIQCWTRETNSVSGRSNHDGGNFFGDSLGIPDVIQECIELPWQDADEDGGCRRCKHHGLNQLSCFYTTTMRKSTISRSLVAYVMSMLMLRSKNPTDLNEESSKTVMGESQAHVDICILYALSCVLANSYHMDITSPPLIDWLVSLVQIMTEGEDQVDSMQWTDTAKSPTLDRICALFCKTYKIKTLCVKGSQLLAAFCLVFSTRVLRNLPFRIRRAIASNDVFSTIASVEMLQILSTSADANTDVLFPVVSDDWLPEKVDMPLGKESAVAARFKPNLEKNWDGVLVLLRRWKGEMGDVAPGTLNRQQARSLGGELFPQTMLAFSFRLFHLLCKSCLPIEDDVELELRQPQSSKEKERIQKLHARLIEDASGDRKATPLRANRGGGAEHGFNVHAATFTPRETESTSGGSSDQPARMRFPASAQREFYPGQPRPTAQSDSIAVRIPPSVLDAFAESSMERFFVLLLDAIESERLYISLQSLCLTSLFRAVDAAKKWACSRSSSASYEVARNVMRARLVSKFLAFLIHRTNWMYSQDDPPPDGRRLECEQGWIQKMNLAAVVQDAKSEASVFVTLCWLEPFLSISLSDPVALSSDWLASGFRELQSLWSHSLYPKYRRHEASAGDIASLMLICKMSEKLGFGLSTEMGDVDASRMPSHSESEKSTGKDLGDSYGGILDDSRLERLVLPELDDILKLLLDKSRKKPSEKPQASRRIVPHPEGDHTIVRNKLFMSTTPEPLAAKLQQLPAAVGQPGGSDNVRKESTKPMPMPMHVPMSELKPLSIEDPERALVQAAIRRETFKNLNPRLPDLIKLAKSVAKSQMESVVASSGVVPGSTFECEPLGKELVQNSVGALVPDVPRMILKALAIQTQKELEEELSLKFGIKLLCYAQDLPCDEESCHGVPSSVIETQSSSLTEVACKMLWSNERKDELGKIKRDMESMGVSVCIPPMFLQGYSNSSVLLYSGSAQAISPLGPPEPRYSLID